MLPLFDLILSTILLSAIPPRLHPPSWVCATFWSKTGLQIPSPLPCHLSLMCQTLQAPSQLSPFPLSTLQLNTLCLTSQQLLLVLWGHLPFKISSLFLSGTFFPYSPQSLSLFKTFYTNHSCITNVVCNLYLTVCCILSYFSALHISPCAIEHSLSLLPFAVDWDSATHVISYSTANACSASTAKIPPFIKVVYTLIKPHN